MKEGLTMYVPDMRTYEIPNSYTLENKLLYICVYEFLQDKMLLEFKELDAKQIKNELATLLIKTFKYSFTSIEVQIEGVELTGHIVYTGGNPLDFILRNTQFKNENEN